MYMFHFSVCGSQRFPVVSVLIPRRPVEDPGGGGQKWQLPHQSLGQYDYTIKIYICMYIYIYIYIYVCLCIYICLYMYTCMYMRRRVSSVVEHSSANPKVPGLIPGPVSYLGHGL